MKRTKRKLSEADLDALRRSQCRRTRQSGIMQKRYKI